MNMRTLEIYENKEEKAEDKRYQTISEDCTWVEDWQKT